jgi:elongation factor P
MTLTINDLKRGMVILIENVPHEILSATHSHVGRGGSVLETKLRNLKTGAVFSRNFKQADVFAEAEIEKKKYQFLYKHRGTLWFCESGNPSRRVSLSEDALGDKIKFLIPNLQVEATFFKDSAISVNLPIKVDLKVVEAPPSIRGNTAQGGTKIVKLETGSEISVPLFIKEGDVVRVNTETGEYVERA